MRRADRLFQIVQIIRRRRVTTAAQISDDLEVSKRTVYRDIKDLILAGVPIEGEAGVGYALPKSFDLPPLMFTEDEIEALALGARFVQSWGDPSLGKSAGEVLAKIETVLPDRLKDRISSTMLFAPNLRHSKGIAEPMITLRGAVRDQRYVQFAYKRADGEESQRTVRPLSLAFTAPAWLLTAWCELRNEFRNFRLDRMQGLSVTDETFKDDPGKTFADFLRKVISEEE